MEYHWITKENVTLYLVFSLDLSFPDYLIFVSEIETVVEKLKIWYSRNSSRCNRIIKDIYKKGIVIQLMMQKLKEKIDRVMYIN